MGDSIRGGGEHTRVVLQGTRLVGLLQLLLRGSWGNLATMSVHDVFPRMGRMRVFFMETYPQHIVKLRFLDHIDYLLYFQGGNTVVITGT